MIYHIGKYSGNKEGNILKNKIMKMINGCLISIAIIIVVFFLLKIFQTKDIVFKDEFKTIEFGTKVEYKDLIETLENKEAKVTYPEGEIKEVGTYEVTYIYELDGDKKKIEHTFEVVDTKIPEMELYINDKKVQVALNKTDYDVTSNIKKVINLDEGVVLNKLALSKEDYKKNMNSLKKANKELDSTVAEKGAAKVDLVKNAVLYTTDLDTTKVGTYTVKAFVVDDNCNQSEELTWKVKVVPGGKVLNSGGKVECDYNGDALEEEAYTTSIKEVYEYNPMKLVEKLELITTMVFKEDYGTEQNKTALSSAIEEKYAALREEKGITITINADKTQVITNIAIDFLQYDLKKDPLNILVKKDGSYVKIESIIESAEQNKFICTVL